MQVEKAFPFVSRPNVSLSSERFRAERRDETAKRWGQSKPGRISPSRPLPPHSHSSPVGAMESYLGGPGGALLGAGTDGGVSGGGGASVNLPLTTGLRSSPSQSS